jgi:AraC-like DNA-binding protein
MNTTTIYDFYREISDKIPDEIAREIGHFNLFSYKETTAPLSEKTVMPYSSRTYYKISLIKGRNRVEYADKVIEIEKAALVFATPKVPYCWYRLEPEQDGYFCIFNDEFLLRNKSGMVIDNLPIFHPGGCPVFQISEGQVEEIAEIFRKMRKELASAYIYKYDLIRNYVLELVHYGQKLQPAHIINPEHSAATRIISLFVELLERQFPIDAPEQRLLLRSAKDYARRLSVHINHLNKVLKENTGKTTSEIIAGRVVQEAKILLKNSDWNISEIAYVLGFEEVAHFSNFFKRQTGMTPLGFRVV